MAFVKRNLRHVQGNQGFNSPGLLEIPEEVFEELLVNALAHRDSSSWGQKEVSGQLNKVIRDLLAAKRIEYTIPDKPNSRLQQYRISRL